MNRNRETAICSTRAYSGLSVYVVSIGMLLGAGASAGCSRAPEAAASASPSPALGAGVATAAAADAQPVAKSAATSRKIVRQADLELEVPSPSATQTIIERLAEQHGGYVVSAARDTDHESAVDVRVTVAVRVPQTELTCWTRKARSPRSACG